MGRLQEVGRWLISGALLIVLLPGMARGQGVILGGAGAQHFSMAGASTAMGVDALGALYWNPAAIRSLPGSEVVIGGEFIIPDTHVASFIPAGAFGSLGPDTTLSGLTRSDSGVVPATAVGLVYQPEDSRLSYGVGVLTLAAGGVNFPGDPGNPVLAATGPLNGASRLNLPGPLPDIQGGPGQRFDRLIQALNGRIDRINERLANVDQRLDQFNPGIILGPQAGSLLVLSITPSVAFQVTDRLVVAGGPMIDVSVISFDPAFFGPLSRSGTLAQFPTGSHTRPFWGGGFRAGATYRLTDHLSTGFSFTSPQWFETWKFNGRTATGDPLPFETQFSLPMILSAGVAYGGIDRLLLAADVRWFDYRTTDLLGEPVIEGGAGWDSIWAVATGARYQLTDRLSVQAGYLYNENPVPENLALFNTLLPALTEHTITAGAYFQLNESIGMALGYVHGFKNSITGSIFPLLGTSTTVDTEYDAITFGVHIKFGGPSRREACVCEGPSPLGDQVPTDSSHR